MKSVLVLLWMTLPFSFQQFVYYPEYYYPQPPVIYYDPYAQPCCTACPLFRITYKCKQRKPTEKTSASVPQATLPHMELETTLAQITAYSTQELPTTNAPVTAPVGRSTTATEERETSTTVILPSTITEMTTLEAGRNSAASLMTTERTETIAIAETEASIIAREMTTEVPETVTSTSRMTEMRTLEVSTNSAETLMTTEVPETSTIADTTPATAREMTTEEVPEAATLPSTTPETNINSATAAATVAREMTIEEAAETDTNSVGTEEAEITITEEPEVSTSPKVAETIHERIEFSSKGWILVSERGEDTTQFKLGEETTSEYPSTESTTVGIVNEAADTEEVFQNSDISEIETTMSSYFSTEPEELSAITQPKDSMMNTTEENKEPNDNLMHTTEENKETTMTEDVPDEIKLLPMRLPIGPQKELVATTESEKNFPSEVVTYTVTAVPFTTKPPRRKRTRKPKRKTTIAPTTTVSTTTKAPVAFFPDVDAV